MTKAKLPMSNQKLIFFLPYGFSYLYTTFINLRFIQYMGTATKQYSDVLLILFNYVNTSTFYAEKLTKINKQKFIMNLSFVVNGGTVT